MANYKDGKIRDGSSIGSGSSIGNIKDGKIRDGGSLGAGKTLGNIKENFLALSDQKKDKIIEETKNGKYRMVTEISKNK